MYPEADLLPLSGLQHLVFCERQCALIHVERAWSENVFTAEGRILHEKADSARTESRGDLRIARSLRLRSLRLGLSGIADVVEFHRVEETGRSRDGPGRLARLSGARGFWLAFPVEYKRGKPKKDNSDKVQLCAQALCLEEMLETDIPAGALFYGTTRRRLDVEFEEDLRAETEALAEAFHRLYESRKTPPAVYGKKCDSCSLFDRCQPKSFKRSLDAERYLESALRAVERDDAGEETP